MQDYRDIIKAELERRDWTVYHLCLGAGLKENQNFINKWLRGEKKDINATTLAKLAAALGLELRQTGRGGRG